MNDGQARHTGDDGFPADGAAPSLPGRSAASGGASEGLRVLVGKVADTAVAASTAGQIDQIRALEDLKSACAAAQARITAVFVAARCAAAGHDAAREASGGAGGSRPVAASGTDSPAGPDGAAAADVGRGGLGAGGERGGVSSRAVRLARRSAAAEIGLARRESPQRGGRLVGLAEVLMHEMPHTFAALRSGVLNEWRARLIVRETACLTREQRARVDAELCADLSRLEGVGDARLAAWAKKVACRLDPAAIAQRSVRAAADRRVSVRPAPDSMAYLTQLLPMPSAVACFASLQRAVDTGPQAPGDGRTRAQRIADESVARLMGDRPVTAAGLSAAGRPGGASSAVPGDTRCNAAPNPAAPNPAAANPAVPDPVASDGSVSDPVAVIRDAYAEHRSRCAGEAAAGVVGVGEVSAGTTLCGPDGDVGPMVPAGLPGHVPAPPGGRPHRPSGSPPVPASNTSQGTPPDIPQDAPPGAAPVCGADSVPPGTGVVLNVTISDAALLAGGDEPAVLPGNSPMPARLVRRMVAELPADARVWVRRLYTRPGTGELVAMESRVRVFTPGMRRLLFARDQDVCRTPWCNAPARHADHLMPAAAGGRTAIGNGQALSEDCNYIRTAPGWAARRDGPDGAITVTTPTGHAYRSPTPAQPGAHPDHEAHADHCERCAHRPDHCDHEARCDRWPRVDWQSPFEGLLEIRLTTAA